MMEQSVTARVLSALYVHGEQRHPSCSSSALRSATGSPVLYRSKRPLTLLVSRVRMFSVMDDAIRMKCGER